MSRKKRRKFYNSPSFQPGQPANAAPANNSAGITDSSTMSGMPPVSYSAAPISATPSPAQLVSSAGDAHVEEYRVIKHDLIRVVILNAIFLAGVLTLYYTNLNSHYLERWFGQILHF